MIPPIYPRCRVGRELEPVVTSHREFLVKLEQQLELQGELVRKMVSIQEEILRKLEYSEVAVLGCPSDGGIHGFTELLCQSS